MCGIGSESIQKRLLEKEDLELDMQGNDTRFRYGGSAKKRGRDQIKVRREKAWKYSGGAAAEAA